jgi:pilus assembly protein Flp/PilA
MRSLCSQFVRNESGATAIEYGLVVAGIAIAILGTINTLSEAVKATLFDVIAAAAG